MNMGTHYEKYTSGLDQQPLEVSHYSYEHVYIS